MRYQLLDLSGPRLGLSIRFVVVKRFALWFETAQLDIQKVVFVERKLKLVGSDAQELQYLIVG